MDNQLSIESMIRYVEQKSNNTNGMIEIPVFRAIPCGPPNYIDNEIQGFIEIPEKMLGAGEYYILRAKGDSMVDAGIADQDLVIIKKQDYAEENQIAVALVEGEVTLKRVHVDNKNKVIELLPDN